jgi:hypothetical protein
MEIIFLVAAIVIVPWVIGVVNIFKFLASPSREKRLAKELSDISIREQNGYKKGVYLAAVNCLGEIQGMNSAPQGNYNPPTTPSADLFSNSMGS